MKEIRRLISDEYIFTQDYDNDNSIYTETFSFSFIDIRSVAKIYLESINIVPNFYKFFNTHENNILISILTGNLDNIDKYRNTSLLCDNRQGVYSNFTNQIFIEKQSNFDKPIRFAYENINENDYNQYSAKELIKNFNHIISLNCTKPNNFNLDFYIENNDEFLFIITHVAGLQFTSIALNGYFNLGLYYIYHN
jgi:hypothetical protein